VESARLVGDVLAVAVLAITSFGLVRSCTAPTLLLSAGYPVAFWVAVAVG
jgi:hypothetical protein